MYTTSVGSAAIIAAAMWTLYSRSPVDVLTTLLSATVIGALSPVENDAPNRKSFQILVNCQITVTTTIGSEFGTRIRKKIEKKRAPSIIADLISSSGKAM